VFDLIKRFYNPSRSIPFPGGQHPIELPSCASKKGPSRSLSESAAVIIMNRAGIS
jgi:hypothetical protein